MKLGVDLALGHIVLDRDPASPFPKVHTPRFSAHVYSGQTAGWIKVPLGTEVGLGPGRTALDGDLAPPPKRDTAPNSRPMSVVIKRLD